MKVHYIENEHIKVAFFPETKRFFQVNPKACKLIDAMVAERPKEDILKEFELDESMYQSYFDNVFGTNNSCDCSKTHTEQICQQGRVLSRLVIHLTNDCNMRCKYCYANGGAYASTRDMMSKAMLDMVVDTFFTQFDAIKNIQFFGGEPLMNLSLLKYGCELIQAKAKDREQEIGFGLVTNGTLIDQAFINLVKKYNLHVTVSYDGNPKVNDIMRVMADGSGSTNTILENAKWLKQETGQPETIEVTYNKYHVDNGVGVLDIVRHIHQEIPDTGVHLVPAGGSDSCYYAIHDLQMFPDSVKELVAIKKRMDTTGEILPLYSLAERIFFALEQKDAHVPYICDAGIGTISVSTKGDVYPCFMFTDNEELCYGNIANPDLFQSARAQEVSDKLLAFSSKNSNPECKECFIRKLCNGCLGLNSFHSGSPFVLSDQACTMFRDMTDQALLGYAEIFGDVKETSGQKG